MADIRIKFCGLTRAGDVAAAMFARAAYIGLVFYERSPRHLALDLARDLALAVPPGVARVALVVDADDAEMDAIAAQVPIDMWQLHGAESPERIVQVRARHGLPVMKAVGVAEPDDLRTLDAYVRVADQILVDAKPPSGAALPGGNGLAFDWRLIAGRRWPVPWMLAGGLTVANVAEAIRLTGARQVDVSSGVEEAPGVKDVGLIADFARAARAAG